MDNKTNVRPIRVRYVGNVSAAKYGLYLDDGSRLEEVLAKALGANEGGNPVDFLGEIIIMVRPLEGAGLTVEEVTGNV